jgi:predicted transcriptional regulator
MMNEVKRKKFISENQKEWVLIGENLKKSREDAGYSMAYVARNLGISPSRLKKFESGQPVDSAKLIESAYKHFMKLCKVKKSMRNVTSILGGRYL